VGARSTELIQLMDLQMYSAASMPAARAGSRSMIWPGDVRAPLLVERRHGEERPGAYPFTIRRGAALAGGGSPPDTE
jgi:hypothetical protein